MPRRERLRSGRAPRTATRHRHDQERDRGSHRRDRALPRYHRVNRRERLRSGRAPRIATRHLHHHERDRGSHRRDRATRRYRGSHRRDRARPRHQGGNRRERRGSGRAPRTAASASHRHHQGASTSPTARRVPAEIAAHRVGDCADGRLEHAPAATRVVGRADRGPAEIAAHRVGNRDGGAPAVRQLIRSENASLVSSKLRGADCGPAEIAAHRVGDGGVGLLEHAPAATRGNQLPRRAQGLWFPSRARKSVPIWTPWPRAGRLCGPTVSSK